MSRLVLAASLVAAAALAACSATPIAPPASPSGNPASPSVPPTIAPPPSVTPPPAAVPPAPTPTPLPPIVTPRPVKPPAPAAFTANERYLRDGIRRGATDCQPVRGADDLPKQAIAGIECNSPDRAIARIGYYLFANDDDMVAAYLWRMTAEGVELDSGSCYDGEGENAYTPGEGFVLDRHGCFLNDEGYANYRATMPGSHVYIGILGRSADMRALEDFAWRGNQDTPGNPTLWFSPS